MTVESIYHGATMLLPRFLRVRFSSAPVKPLLFWGQDELKNGFAEYLCR